MKMDKKELAIAYHDKKFNCCQAVACAFAGEVGVSEEVLFKAGEGSVLAWAVWKVPAVPCQVLSCWLA